MPMCRDSALKSLCEQNGNCSKIHFDEELERLQKRQKMNRCNFCKRRTPLRGRVSPRYIPREFLQPIILLPPPPPEIFHHYPPPFVPHCYLENLESRNRNSSPINGANKPHHGGASEPRSPTWRVSPVNDPCWRYSPNDEVVQDMLCPFCPQSMLYYDIPYPPPNYVKPESKPPVKDEKKKATPQPPSNTSVAAPPEETDYELPFEYTPTEPIPDYLVKPFSSGCPLNFSTLRW